MKISKSAFFLNLLILISPSSAYAYFDPGSGAVMLQVLIAGAIGLLYRFRSLLTNIFELIKRLFRK